MLNDLKIVRVSTVSFFIETQLSRQLEAMVEAGAEVYVIASEEKLNREIKGINYFSIGIPRKINVLKDFVALIKIFIFFIKNKPDIVHSTTPKAGLLCSIAAKMAGVKIRLHTFTGQPWVELKGIKYFLSKYSDVLIGALNSFNYADSESQKDFLINTRVVKKEKISVIGSGSLAGVDVNKFDKSKIDFSDRDKIKKELNISDDDKVAIFIGRISKDKGIFELIEAFERIRKNDDNVKLIILGPIEDNSIFNININFVDDIKFIGFKKNTELYLSIADYLVLPSYREGFGTVILESAAMGIPAVASNIYGVSDAVIDGQTGVLVPVRDVNALSSAMHAMFNNDLVRNHMGRNARERVLAEFSSNIVNNIVLSEYKRLIDAARK